MEACSKSIFKYRQKIQGNAKQGPFAGPSNVVSTACLGQPETVFMRGSGMFPVKNPSLLFSSYISTFTINDISIIYE